MCTLDIGDRLRELRLCLLFAVAERIEDPQKFPFNLPFVTGLDLAFRSGVTLFVGETGSGKSTVLEAIAALSGFPVTGGGKNENGPIRRGDGSVLLLVERSLEIQLAHKSVRAASSSSRPTS